MSRYVSMGELSQFGISAKALAAIPELDKIAAIEAASGIADTLMQTVVGVPLSEPVPLSVKVHVAWMAIFILMSPRGFNRDGDDKILEDNYNRGMAFFKDVSKGTASLGPTVTPPIDDPSDDNEGPFVYSDVGRGYPTDGNV